MSGPKFGVSYSRIHEQIKPANFAMDVEQLGYDTVWAIDGLVNQLAALDPIIVMAEFARATERLKVGSCIIVNPLRNPAIFAKQISSLDFLFPERFIIGVAPGGPPLSNPSDFDVSGISHRERGARCSEGIEVMKKLWTGEKVSHHGRFFNFDDIYLLPKPVQTPHPPVWVGGNVDPAVKRTALLGDGFIPVGAGAEDYKRLWGDLCRYAEEAGRDPSKITRAVHIFYCLADNRDEAHGLVEKTLTKRYGFDVKIDNDKRFAFGNPDECAEVIESYISAGVEEFVINTVRPLPEVCSDIEKFAEKILPKFR